MTKPISAHSIAERLSIVIPAFNEEDGIGPTLHSLLERLPGAEIIVVDDGSSDRTLARAAEFTNVVLAQHPFNRGYGAALKTGMTIARREYIAWFDADNEHRVSDLEAMACLAMSEKIAAVIAQRRFSGPSPLRNWGKIMIRLLARSLAFDAGSDINCGLRVFRRDVIARYIPLLPNSFSASITSTMILLERRYPVIYHSVDLNRRIGSSKVTASDGFSALMMVLRILLLFAPMRVFLRFGFVLFSVGLLYGVAAAIVLGRGIPVLAVAVMIVGALTGFSGLIADQISQLRLVAYDQPVYRIVRDASSSQTHDGEAARTC